LTSVARVDVRHAFRKLTRFGAVLILPQDNQHFTNCLITRGIPYEASYVADLDAYLFTTKLERG